MKKIYVLVVAVSLLSVDMWAQTAAKSIFAEIGGPGVASLNFDTRFNKKEDGLGMRAGFGGFSVDGSGVIFLPVGLNYLIGKDGKNYFEVGAGITPIITTGDASIEGDGPFETTFGHLNIGYRLQPPKSGFTFRASINPVFGKKFFWPYYAGVSFGYKF
jgi:hypothetical protein